MSDLLAGLIAVTPYQGFGAFGAQAAAVTFQATAAEQALLAANVPIEQQDWSGALNSLAPLLPEPGIHWTSTGGKSWRVVIVR